MRLLWLLHGDGDPVFFYLIALPTSIYGLHLMVWDGSSSMHDHVCILASEEKIGENGSLPFCSQPIGQNLVTWAHLCAKESEKWSLIG